MKACKLTKRPPNVINEIPENERCFNKTVPGNSSSAEISRQKDMYNRCIAHKENRHARV